MRKSDIVKLVFAVLLTIVAIFCCVMSVSIRVGLEEAKDQVEGKEAVAFIFGAAFGFLIAIVFALAGLLADLIAVLLCAFGLRSPIGWMKVTFLVLLILHFVVGLVISIGTFAGL